MPLITVRCTLTLEDVDRARYQDSYGREPPAFPIGEDPLIRDTMVRLAERVEVEERSSGTDLKLLGRHLYRHVFGGPGSVADLEFRKTYRAFQEFRRADPNQRLRLVLAFENEAAQLATLPWEFLYFEPSDEEGFFLAGHKTELSLTRCMPPVVPDGLRPAGPPLRVLVAACTPHPLDRTKAGEVADDVLRLADPDRVDVRPLDNPRYSDLQAAVGQDEGDGPWYPHLLHLVGHGSPHGFALRMEEEEHREHVAAGGDEADETKWIGASHILRLFPPDQRPRLVFLHSCESGAPGAVFGGVASIASGLIAERIPAVIAMRYTVGSDDAAAFSHSFYAQIREGMPIDEAVTHARYDLATLPSTPEAWSHRRFGTPLLYLQSDQAVILEAPAVGTVRQYFACPYEAYNNCRGKIFPEYRRCRVCKKPVAWCVNGHPNTAEERECALCDATLATAARATSPGATGETSGFQVESSPWPR
jgi:hypothetical protein